VSRTLRGAWSRRHVLVPLLLMTTVLVGGVVAVLGFADAAGTATELAAPLVLLGLVAVPDTGRELARVRREEIALARLRGLEGRELVAVLAREPLLVLAAGGLLGLVVGAAGARVCAALWVDAPAGGPGPVALLAGVAVVAVALVVVVAGMHAALGEPLSDQVRATDRPRAAGIGTLFVEVLLVTGALVAVYRSRQATGPDLDLVVLAGPALVGLAVGQVLVWLAALAARPVVRLTAGGGLAGFLAARRLARVTESVQPLRVLVAAGVVGTLAWTASAQVSAWTDESARLRVGAPLQVTYEGETSEALDLTRRLDPEGRYLAAAALVEDYGQAVARRAFVDAARYPRVVDGFVDGETVERQMRLLRGQADAMPVLATRSAVWTDTEPGIVSPGAHAFPAVVVETVPALPLVEADGLLADLVPAIAFDGSTVPAATVYVLARADTPPALLDDVVEAAGHPPVTVADARREITDDGGAAQAQIYAVMAGCCLLVALLALGTAVSRRRAARLRELATLRALGVDHRLLARAGTVEDLWLAGAALVATTAGALSAVRLLLGRLDLVTEPEHALALAGGVDPVPLVAVAAAAAVAVLVAGRRSRAGWVAASRPATLRDDVR